MGKYCYPRHSYSLYFQSRLDLRNTIIQSFDKGTTDLFCLEKKPDMNVYMEFKGGEAGWKYLNRT